ncbi:photosynthetic complex putative assembly protein PuhB [Nereida sp. MMG025]|uniref:photosynthetic complex putative assembly protein PuhB n=1 Tax=Nereida sp. MMG025 TaxID=2909981 RepID=UPI001F3FE1AE|nr:photosynthetic complex putative assembly protein PuhB [Nereida sp. MMG025]MCF6446009.1 PH domain-containing protein [Nereida sp. MMG025]
MPHDHDDFAVEPIKGLPELPPEGEEILWQGRPNWWALAKESLSLKWVAAYFVFLALWRFVAVMDLMPLSRAIQTSVPFLVLGAIAIALLVLIAYVQARATVYTITNRRVAMRIGAALTMTLNLPYQWIGNANLDLRKSGTGTIALQTTGSTKLSYVMCWPHVRPWRMARTEPALRCIPDAANVAQILAAAAETRVSQAPQIQRAASPDAVAAE